jgi:hypothetical protein
MAEIPRDCDTHQDIVGFKYPFPHLMRSLKLLRKIKIVAVGSSSTAGEGDVVPYPAGLELLLRGGFHDRRSTFSTVGSAARKRRGLCANSLKFAGVL